MYKDKDKQREAVREAVQRHRAKKKEEQAKKTVFFEIKGDKYGIEFWEENTNRELTPEETIEKEQLKANLIESFVKLKDLKDRGIISDAEIDNILKCIIPTEEPSKNPSNILNFIPNLLSMHLDFKMLHQRGSKKGIGGY